MIEDQTGLSFFYSTKYVKDQEEASAPGNNQKLDALLKRLFEGKSITWQYKEERIVLMPLKPEKYDMTLQDIRDMLVDTLIDVKGRVKGPDDLPIEGATISIVGTLRGAKSDAKGDFTLNNVPSTARIRVTYLGFDTVMVRANSASISNVVLRPSMVMLKAVETVSTGYQDLNKDRAPGSFFKMDNKLVNRAVSTSVMDRLVGVVSGMNYTTSSQLRQGQSSFSIRGFSTIRANANPLIVVDGFPLGNDVDPNGFIASLNPNDVESITVLKDAAAASIWGARSGNGVIVINTKSGKSAKKTNVSFNGNITVVSKPDLYYLPQMDAASSVEFESILYDRGYFDLYDDLYPLLNRYPAIPSLSEQYLKYRKGEITDAQLNSIIDDYKDNDLRKDISKYLYQDGINQQYAVNVSGASLKHNYYLSFGYDKNRGNSVGDENERYTIAARNTMKVGSRVEISLNTNIARIETKSNSESFGSLPNYYKLKDKDGNNLAVPVLGSGLRDAYIDTVGYPELLDWHYVPLNELEYNDISSKLNDIRVGASIRYNIISGLNVELRSQYQYRNTKNVNNNSIESYYVRNLINKFQYVDNNGNVQNPIPIGNILGNRNSDYNSWNVRGSINYINNSLGDFKINSTTGAEMREGSTDVNGSIFYGFNPRTGQFKDIDYLNRYAVRPRGSSTLGNSLSTAYLIDRAISYFTSNAVTFNNKYTLSLSARMDGSNYFGVKANQRIIPLWSVGLLWNLYEEDFIKNKTWINELKFRATYGINGNTYSGVANYATISYSSTVDYVSQFSYAYLTTPPNRNLKWERVQMLNFGIDFSFFKRRVSGSLEYYNKRATDLIGNQRQNETTGISSLLTNYASIKGYGIDLVLNSLNVDREMKWRTSLLLSYNNDRIIDYDEEATSAAGYVATQGILQKGKPLYSLYAYRWAGLNPENGDPMIYVGDKKTNFDEVLSKITIQDVKYIGPITPRVYGSIRNSFSYRNLELSFNMLYKFDYFFLRPSLIYSTLLSKYVGHKDFSQRWKKKGDEVHTNVPSFPESISGPRDSYYNYADINSERGDNIRFKDIRLTYSIPRKLNKLKKMPYSISVYSYVNDIGLIWKKNTVGIDPDYVNSLVSPISYSLGIKVDFL
ncbi:SusC/RagA family TonB-linked outer membrane protein [Chitinophaga caeni]|nr:SusC/RagA family TonB-linked outer membrane protein [Chitinophaga caeni]